MYLPQVGLCCTPDHNHHGDIEEGEEEDRDQEEDNEGDLVDWVPLKHKVYEIKKISMSTSGMSSMAQQADSGAGGPLG